MAATPGTAASGHACLWHKSPSQGAGLHRLNLLSTQAVSGGAFQQHACRARTVRPLTRRWDTLVAQADKEQVHTVAGGQAGMQSLVSCSQALLRVAVWSGDDH